MRECRNNVNRIIQDSKLYARRSKLADIYLKLLALSSLLFAICYLLYPDKANSGPYLESAHGSLYGVKRIATGFPSDYTQGLCAHCHEQHASIGGTEPEPNTGGAAGPDIYLLFSVLFVDQNTMFCFRCHRTTNSLQQSMPQQYNYSNIAGGDTGISAPNSIRDAFNPAVGGSSHYLSGIRTFLSNRSWGFGSIANINPCSGCHNPHRAKRDHHGSGTTPQRTDVSGSLIVSAVSLPSQHTNLITWQLWGDENGERMNNKAASAGATYCSPYQYNTTNRREPDGCSTTPTDCLDVCSNGSKLFDTVSFCLDCHQYNTGSTIAINWGPTGDQHGAAPLQVCCDWGDRKSPYSEAVPVNYILSCLDCHEPHGSPNEYLLRSEVNGVHTGPSNGLTFDSHQYWYFCSACHTELSTKHTGASITPTSDCWGCHRHGASQDRCGCTSPPAKVF